MHEIPGAMNYLISVLTEGFVPSVNSTRRVENRVGVSLISKSPFAEGAIAFTCGFNQKRSERVMGIAAPLAPP